MNALNWFRPVGFREHNHSLEQAAVHYPGDEVWSRFPTPQGWGWITAVLLWVLQVSPTAQVQAQDYLADTMVYQTAEKGEIEPELWFDYGKDRDENRYFQRYHTELEYGITERWMMEARFSAGKYMGKSFKFDSAELETRYRLREAGEWPVDVALAAGMELEREREDGDSETEVELEPTLVLARDFDRLNVVLNLTWAYAVDESLGSLLTGLGARYALWDPLAVGVEYVADWREDEGEVVPQLMWMPCAGVAVKTGVSFGVGGRHTDYGRVALEFEF